jgi:Zn-dependent M16 (insulinase) family peptidase
MVAFSWSFPPPLQTFLNAMTYPDRTVYPVASPNLTDFYNLVDVYLDAVFHPRLIPPVFQQEGWIHEVVDGKPSPGGRPAGASLKYKGVVFNEMKGVYSSPDSLHHIAVQEALFPDTVYAHSSGGDPAAIPALTFDQFTAFHQQHYHPSNSLTFFYGDDDENKRLQIAESYLGAFEKRTVTPTVPTQVGNSLQPFNQRHCSVNQRDKD